MPHVSRAAAQQPPQELPDKHTTDAGFYFIKSAFSAIVGIATIYSSRPSGLKKGSTLGAISGGIVLLYSIYSYENYQDSVTRSRGEEPKKNQIPVLRTIASIFVSIFGSKADDAEGRAPSRLTGAGSGSGMGNGDPVTTPRRRRHHKKVGYSTAPGALPAFPGTAGRPVSSISSEPDGDGEHSDAESSTVGMRLDPTDKFSLPTRPPFTSPLLAAARSTPASAASITPQPHRDTPLPAGVPTHPEERGSHSPASSSSSSSDAEEGSGSIGSESGLGKTGLARQASTDHGVEVPKGASAPDEERASPETSSPSSVPHAPEEEADHGGLAASAPAERPTTPVAESKVAETNEE